MFARVIIDINHIDVNQIYDYIIPKSLLDLVKVGVRVIVPFGNQIRVAFVYGISNESNLASKEIIDVIDLNPILNEESFKMIDYLKSVNDKTDSKLIQTIITPERMFSYNNEYNILNKDKLDDYLIPYIKNNQLKFDEKEYKVKRLVKKEIASNNVEVLKTYLQKGRPKLNNCITINNLMPIIKEKDLEIVEFVKSNSNYNKTNLVELGFSLSQINRLIKNETFKIVKRRVYRLLDMEVDSSIKKIDKLTLDQEKVLKEYNNSKKSVNLLFGVTASGKTEVYIRIIKDVIKKGLQALYLVPDISLIYQIYQRLILEDDFNVVMYHSKVSKGIRFDAISAMENKSANILLGTRSSSFINIPNLGVIIIDEAHDKLYMQEDDVFYDTFEIAKIKGSHFNAPIVLGSATPSISHYYFAKNGKYLLLNLPKKVVNTADANLLVVDMKEELKNGNTSIISNQLHNLILEKLKNKEQILVLFNQKGYAPFAMCRTCGYVPKDPQTQMSLLYDKNNNVLRSRQTKYQIPFDQTCPICNSNALSPIGVGIEYVYEYFIKKYKNANVAKLESSILNKKGAYESLINDFKEEKIDILVGTQMISKGLDFKNVTLSVVLMADTFFNIPSNLASEDAYMTFMQMIGRSARHLSGDAIIQAYDTDNYVIKSLNKSYENFYNQAIYEREIRSIEPFYNTLQVGFYGNKYLNTYQEALMFIKGLPKTITVLGPSEAFYKKANYEFGFVVTLKYLPNEKIDLKMNFDKISKLVFVSVKSIHQIL